MKYKTVQNPKQLLLVDPRKGGFVSPCNLVEKRRRKSLVTYNIVDGKEMGFCVHTDNYGCSWVPNKYLFEMETDEDQGN